MPPVTHTPATFPLLEVQTWVLQGKYRVTQSALDTAAELDLDQLHIRQVVLALTSQNFYKTMPSTKILGEWQDVYRANYQGDAFYVKFKVVYADANTPVVILSFKEL